MYLLNIQLFLEPLPYFKTPKYSTPFRFARLGMKYPSPPSVTPVHFGYEAVKNEYIEVSKSPFQLLLAFDRPGRRLGLKKVSAESPGNILFIYMIVSDKIRF